jgi:hypothetical protein
MAATTVLGVPFLVTGYLDPASLKDGDKRALAGTLTPVANRFFTYLDNTKQESLVGTDETGKLRSVDAKLQALDPKHLAVGLPMELNILPPGLVRQSFFGTTQDWQKELIQAIRGKKMEHVYKTIPIKFEKKDLQKPEEGDETGKAWYDKFKDGVKYQGQLFPRFQGLFFLLPGAMFSGGGVQARLLLHGKEEKTFKAKGNGDKKKIEKENSLSLTPEHSEFVFFYWASAVKSIPEGQHTLEIPGASLNRQYFHSESKIFHTGLKFGCDVKFSISNLMGDFDYHVLHPISLESALMSNFPDSYAHLHKAMFASEGAEGGSGGGEGGGEGGPSKAAKTTLKNWAEGFEWYTAKQKMVLGYINANTEARLKSLALAALGSLIDSDDDGVKNVAKTVKGFWETVEKGAGFVKEWKEIRERFKIIEENEHKLKLVKQAVTGNFFSKAYKKTKWQRYVVKELQEAEEAAKDAAKTGEAVARKESHVMLELAKKEADPAVLEKLMADGIPKEAKNFEKMFGSQAKTAAKALWVLDTAYSLYSVYSTLHELSEKSEEAETQLRRLDDAIEKFVEKSKGAVNPIVMERLDGLRKLADAARMGLSEAETEALKQAVEFTLKAALVVPVIGEFAAIISLGMEAYDLLKGLTVTACEVYFGDFYENYKRLDLIDKEYQTNVQHVMEHGKSGHDKPAIQFRLRALALLGFVRLLHRCGSRVAKKDEFAKKVKEYDLQGYIRAFLLIDKPVKFPVYAGISIDQLWLYSNGGKNPDWNQKWNGTAYTGLSGLAFDMDFHKHFPIHGVDAKSTAELAETFCVDYAGVITDEAVFSGVYAREIGETRWTLVRDYQKPITPLTEIRVVAIFRGDKDLTGIPISFQLFRTDTFPDVGGPVYKVMLVKARKSMGGRGEDQGLLDYTDEKNYLNADCYCCVINPFYTFRETLYKGIKPCGHIGLSAAPSIDVGFKMGAGAQKAWVSVHGRDTDFTVHLPLSDKNIGKLMLQMICETPFLDCKTDKQAFRRLFMDILPPEYLGCILRSKGSHVYYPASIDSFKQGDFEFGWGRAFEIIFLFHSQVYGDGWQNHDPIRFPAFIQTKEFTGIDKVGPSYPVEVFSLRTHRAQEPSSVTVATLGAELKEKGILDSLDAILPPTQLQFKKPGYLWACVVKFSFEVEGRSGELEPVPGFKPFSGTFAHAPDEYRFGFGISTPDPLGLNLPDLIEMSMPPLPKDFLGQTEIGKRKLLEKFVTESRVHQSRSIHAVDIE